MEQMHSVVMKMKPVVKKAAKAEIKKEIVKGKVTKEAVKHEVVKNEVKKAHKAANTLSYNLQAVSAEMESGKLTAKEWEDKKNMVISWVNDFEDIVAKAEPIAEARE